MQVHIGMSPTLRLLDSYATHPYFAHIFLTDLLCNVSTSSIKYISESAVCLYAKASLSSWTPRLVFPKHDLGTQRHKYLLKILLLMHYSPKSFTPLLCILSYQLVAFLQYQTFTSMLSRLSIQVTNFYFNPSNACRDWGKRDFVILSAITGCGLNSNVHAHSPWKQTLIMAKTLWRSWISLRKILACEEDSFDIHRHILQWWYATWKIYRAPLIMFGIRHQPLRESCT